MTTSDEREPTCYFASDGEDRFVPTGWTRGPWDARFQHGGPPSALLGRALARAVASEPHEPARFWIELRRPVPIRPLRVVVEAVRIGRSTSTASATLLDRETELVRASALFVRHADLALDAARLPGVAAFEPQPSPETVRSFSMPFFRHPVGYHASIDLRIARGTWARGPVLAWFRARCAVVEGETPTPLERVLIAADSVHGVAPPLDMDVFSFVNPDLAVHLSRLARGEWVALDAWTAAEPTGVGIARSTLYDADGPIGATLQSLVIAPRAPSP